MKKNYTYLYLTIFFCVELSLAQVGVGTTTPDAELDIVANSVTGNALQVNHESVSNASSAAWIRNSGIGLGLNLQNLGGSGSAAALQITQLGFGPGLVNIMNENSIGVVNDLVSEGGIGSVSLLGVNDGFGYVVSAVDNPATATAGGDVFAFDGLVNTFTPTSTSVFGSVFSGQQFGVGHGILINHEGTSGRNAEFNINNPQNADAAINAFHLGTGSAIVAQNQSASLPATIAVADFAYTGIDLDDHVGVAGFSAPAFNFGIGVEGTGNWYGVHGVAGTSGIAVFGVMLLRQG